MKARVAFILMCVAVFGLICVEPCFANPLVLPLKMVDGFQDADWAGLMWFLAVTAVIEAVIVCGLLALHIQGCKEALFQRHPQQTNSESNDGQGDGLGESRDIFVWRAGALVSFCRRSCGVIALLTDATHFS